LIDLVFPASSEKKSGLNNTMGNGMSAKGMAKNQSRVKIINNIFTREKKIGLCENS
jgi:hypothetical protein